jgi:hypothetical protein
MQSVYTLIDCVAFLSKFLLFFPPLENSNHMEGDFCLSKIYQKNSLFHSLLHLFPSFFLPAPHISLLSALSSFILSFCSLLFVEYSHLYKRLLLDQQLSLFLFRTSNLSLSSAFSPEFCCDIRILYTFSETLLFIWDN